jgi:anti-sigma factor RsiW
MICTELDQNLFPYLDGEFEAAERASVEEHLASCGACAKKVADQAHFRSTLRAQLKAASPPAPERLRASIRQGLQAEGRRSQLLGMSRWAAPALAAAALGGVFLAFRLSAHQGVVEDAAVRHARKLPYEVEAGSAAQLEAWFEGKLDYRVAVPQLANAKPAGARLSNLREHEAAYIGYQVYVPPNNVPRRVGLFVMPDTGHAPSAWPQVEVHDVRGFRVVDWSSAGMVYELVTDLDEPVVRQLLLANPMGESGPKGAGARELPVIPASLSR